MSARDALSEVRLAYRLIQQYQRAILDLTAHVGQRLQQARPDVAFHRWRPLRHTTPPAPDIDPGADGRWAWEMLPLHHASFTWTTAPRPQPGALLVRLQHLADDGFQLGQSEPDPLSFPPADMCGTWLTLRAISPGRAEPQLGWDDLMALVRGAEGGLWEDGRAHRFDSGTHAFWFGGFKVDAAAIGTPEQTEARLMQPLLKLVRGLA